MTSTTRKRRWDVTDRRMDSTPSSAAAEAAARLNAKLAAKGKLTKQDNVILPPPTAIGIASSGSSSKHNLLTTPTNTPSQPGHVYIQEKVFAGLEDAPPGFNVAERLQGPGNAYLNHISTQTGAKAFLRGRGSGYLEPTSGRESFEALHIFISHTQQSGVDNARKLCQSLIDTVKRDYAQMPPNLGFGSAPNFNTVPAVPPGGGPYSMQPPQQYYDHPPGPTGNYPGPMHSLPPPQPYHYPPPPPLMYTQPHPSSHPHQPHPYAHSQQPPPPPPPNAFVDYRTYDKVEVSVAPQSKRKFTEKEEDPPTGNHTDIGSKRKFSEDSSNTIVKRRFIEDENTSAPVKREFSEEPKSKRKFTEGPPEKLLTAVEDSPPLVGKWQDMSQSVTVKPATVPRQPSSTEPESKPREKELMPPPSLPSGLKGLKVKSTSAAAVITPPSDSPNGGIQNKLGPRSAHTKNKSTGLSLLSSYADDSSDSDND